MHDERECLPALLPSSFVARGRRHLLKHSDFIVDRTDDAAAARRRAIPRRVIGQVYRLVRRGIIDRDVDEVLVVRVLTGRGVVVVIRPARRARERVRVTSRLQSPAFTSVSPSAFEFTPVQLCPTSRVPDSRGIDTQQRAPQFNARTSQFPACQGWGRGFESLRPLQFSQPRDIAEECGFAAVCGAPDCLGMRGQRSRKTGGYLLVTGLIGMQIEIEVSLRCDCLVSRPSEPLW